MSRVIVTGATGFVGSQLLVPLLEAGHEVHAISSKPTSQTAPGAEAVVWHRADLTDPSAADGVVGKLRADGLIHLAWYAEHGRYWQAPENVVWVEATLRLLRAFVAAGGRRAVLAGTCAEYEWSGERYSEDSTLSPATLYGVAKHATQLVSAAYAREAGIELAWGRIFMLFGPREDPRRLVPSVARALLAGEPAPVSEGSQLRDFLYVEDVARAFAAIYDSGVQGPVNVASGVARTVREMVEGVAKAVGRSELVRWGAVPHRAGEPRELVADVTRLTDEVGFVPRFELAQGVARTVAWWRDVS